jgi:Tol biopolymer transport system component
VTALDSNGTQDIFVRDLTARTTTLVSVNAAGTTGNGGSYAPAMSQDGTKVAFHSSASDLGPPDGNDADDVFVRSLTARTTTLVSVNAAGTSSGNDASAWPALSPDGTKVAFVSGASDLGPPDPRPSYDIDFDIYVRDLSTGTMTLVSVNAAGTDGGNGWSQNPVFSHDGDTIAFDSYATDLGPRDTNACGPNPTDPSPPCTDIYARHLPSATTGLVSSAGDDSRPRTSSSNHVFHPSDSTKIAFTSVDYDRFVTSTYLATLDVDGAASTQQP